MRKYLANGHSKLALFSFFKGGFGENYQQKKRRILGIRYKEQTLDREWGPGSSHSCTTNNLVTTNTL